MFRRLLSTPLTRVTAALASVVAAATLTGCDLAIHERICVAGEEPTWALNGDGGSYCLAADEKPTPGTARYPRGRVPVWINPPASYPHRTEDGSDRYNRDPNDPDYPWFDEVVAEHPEVACRLGDPVRKVLPLRSEADAGAAPLAVVVRENQVGNRCLSIGSTPNGESARGIQAAELRVTSQLSDRVWESASPGELLRVATTTCLTITARAIDASGVAYTLSDGRFGRCDPAYAEG